MTPKLSKPVNELNNSLYMMQSPQVEKTNTAIQLWLILLAWQFAYLIYIKQSLIAGISLAGTIKPCQADFK